MFYVYVIVDELRHDVYVGLTSNLKRRFDEHKSGKGAKFTRNGNWKLAYYEAFADEMDARDRERKLKHDGRSRYQLYHRINKSLFGHK